MMKSIGANLFIVVALCALSIVVVGGSGMAAYSSDGINWTSLTAGTDTGIKFGWIPNAYSVAYGNGNYVVAGGSGMASYSSDGINWTALPAGTDTGIQFGTIAARSVAYGNDKFVVVGNSGKASYSPDGIHWTSLPAGTGTGIKFGGAVAYSVACGNGTFVAVGGGGPGMGGKASYSFDGITWTALTPGTTTGIRFGTMSAANSVAYGNSEFVVVGDSGKASYSPDGINWTSLTAGADTGIKFGTTSARAVAYVNDKFIVAGDSGKASYSSDGISWTSLPAGADTGIKFGTTAARSVAYGDGNYVVVGDSGMASYSSDGINWTSLPAGTGTGIKFGAIGATSVAYANDKYVVVGNLGAASYSEETPTPTPAATPTPASYDEWLDDYAVPSPSRSAVFDPDGDGWSNIAEYQYWHATGEISSPLNASEGGQAIRLERGWHLIGLSADVCYYVAPTPGLPGENERTMLPASYPAGYRPVAGIGAYLDAMGLAGKVEKISGWHPSPAGGTNIPVTWENRPSLDTLTYLAGGYGYWVKATEACVWKTSGRPRLKARAETESVKLYGGWNLAGGLFAEVHYQGDPPASIVSFGTEESARTQEANAGEYMKSLVRAAGTPSPARVEAMVAYDGEFPYVHTYYSDVPSFLQTLQYVGPGMGVAMKVAEGEGALTIEYPAENGLPAPTPTPVPIVTPTPASTPTGTPTPDWYTMYGPGGTGDVVRIEAMYVASKKERGGCANNGTKNWTAAVSWGSDLAWLEKDDWRLPTQDELSMICVSKARLDSYEPLEYWSSTADDQNRGWLVQFSYCGTYNGFGNSFSSYVRAVRTVDTPPTPTPVPPTPTPVPPTAPPTLTPLPPTITPVPPTATPTNVPEPTNTPGGDWFGTYGPGGTGDVVQIGAMYVASRKEDAGCANNGTKNWTSAVAWANDLVWLAQDDWRLPTGSSGGELSTICESKGLLGGYMSDKYWSGTPGGTEAWLTIFDYCGIYNGFSPGTTCYVRAVRNVQ